MLTYLQWVLNRQEPPLCTSLPLADMLKVMDELLERGADIDAHTKGGCGWTPLHHAAKEKNRKAMEFLIENGAFLPPDIDDRRFNPELHYCPGLELAYEIKKQKESSGFLSSDGTCTEENHSD
eukprot:TRINITY_DN751_c0_g1_i6.p2 TRINITY_DN751_c0_g1~~TRINITY_DN751_c0_g1_i6.p2  ORF type:complete len:123 (-),score=18.25 TRINITY_DN751_c0_g1_i6:238-606(-)